MLSPLIAEAAGIAPRASEDAREAAPAQPGAHVRTVFVVIVVGLLLAVLLNADHLLKGAEDKPFGAGRDFWVAAWTPFENVSDTLYLNRPRQWLDSLTGREIPPRHKIFALPAPPVVARPGVDVPLPEDIAATREDPSGPAPNLYEPPSLRVFMPPAPLLRTPTAAAPLKVWVGGDSMAGVFGQSLLRLAAGTGVMTGELDYRVSTGLTRPDFFDWPAHLAAELKRLNPDVVVVVFGANDTQGLRTPAGQVFQMFSDGWRSEYRRRVAGTMDLLEAPGRLVVWVGQPVMESIGLTEKVNEMNVIYREEAAKRPFVVYVDSAPVLADANGNYSAYLPNPDGSVSLLRAADGIHLSRAGGDRLATVALAKIAREAGVALP